jgi:hypothetical protein
MVADELPAGKALTLIVGQLPGPAHQFGGDANGIRLAIGGALGQHIPNGNEELAGDDDNRLGFGHAASETVELGFPVGEVAHGAPGGFDQRPAEFPAAGFGDFSGAMGLAAIVNGGAQAGVGDELFRMGEAGDIANGSQDGHGQKDAEARDLDEERDLILPRSLSRKVGYLGLQLDDLRGEVFEGGEILTDAELFGGGNGEGLPPGKVGERERIAFGSRKVVAEKEGLKAVGDHGAVMNEAAAVGEETAGVSNDEGWNPDLGDEIGGKQSCKRHGIDLVGLDPTGGDELNQTGVCDDDLGDERGDLVVEIPGVGSGLDDQDVGRQKVGIRPFRPAGELDRTRGEDGFELWIYAADNDVILVEIDGEETGSGWREGWI